MKHAPITDPVLDLTPALADLLTAYREHRGFAPHAYVRDKARALARYAEVHGLKSLVVGVSGGVDSALVAVIAARAAADADLDCVPVFVPAFTDGATGQESAQARVCDLDAALGTPSWIVDMTPVATAAKSAFADAGMGSLAGWSSGQSVPYLRTALLYSVTSLCAGRGRPGIVLGTNNADEGAYIGYFGKASDGMVDVQMLSDVHKNEVYAAARAAGVPASILGAAPTGDMFDGREDAEVLGAGYDFVEFHHAVRTGQVSLDGLSEEDISLYRRAAANLDSLHGHNAHKYMVGSPAIHLDLPLYAPRMSGSWKTNSAPVEVFA